ncbi:MAG: metallophosphoesterase family protein [Polyangiaceae bacterium]
MNTFIIGDLHGCFEEALDLLDRAGLSAGDRIIFAGDLVDRGPKPRECVELAMQHECVLGNHEEKHLQQRRRPAERCLPDHARTRSLLGEEHLDWFATLPVRIALPEHGAAVVHAGAYPGVPLPEQDPYHLLHIQCIRPPDRKSYWPSKAPPNYPFWARHWAGPETLIFGHTVLDKPYVGEHAIGVDTGCAHGGSLTGLLLPARKLVEVPSRQTAKKAGRVALFDILPGSRCYS